MTIPEAQLETWSQQGATAPSRNTYAAVRQVLEDSSAPYAGLGPSVFLQGSYANDTNTGRDSDVDVVVSIDSMFGHDAQTLPAEQYEAFKQSHSDSTYSYKQYRSDVASWLTTKFGNSVDASGKAIFIPASGGRRECDVLPAIEYRYYYRYSSIRDQSYATGICFYLADGTQVINFPKQHSDNCTLKHQGTNSHFKPLVRIYKSMRNHLVDSGELREGTAPSYFIEGMIYNVPNDKFVASREGSFVNSFDYIASADRSAFNCANGIQKLLGSSSVTWRSADCDEFLNALRQLWLDW